MNWLAHTTLSEPDPVFQLGNLLADLVRGADRLPTPHQFQRGCACHQQIDSFTANHPIPRETARLFEPPLRRFAGILTDIFYDHHLAILWTEFYPEPLEDFVAHFHNAAKSEIGRYPQLPESARELLFYVIRTERFLSYKTFDGLEDVLTRLSRRLENRWNRAVPLPDALETFRQNYATSENHFRRFYPVLHRRLRNQKWKIRPMKNEPSETKAPPATDY